jgi:hypothetical protein
VPVGVLLGFLILFTAGVRWSRQPESLPFGALLLAAGAMVTAFVFLGYESIGQRPAVLYALVMGVQVLVMAVTWVRPEARAAQGLAAALGFLHLWSWTTEYLTTPLLGWALGLYLLFGGMQAGFAMGWQRREGEGEKLVACWVPVAAVFLMLLPVVCLPEVGLIVWPALLLADEPTGNLDTQTSHEIMALFEEIHNAGNTIVLVTHEEDIAKHAKKIVRLRDGLIES